MENKPQVLVIDNKTFLLGFDYIFRSFQKKYESEVLLPITNGLVKELSVQVNEVPIEGYYIETPELSRYFLQTRALQDQLSTLETSVTDVDSFKTIKNYVSSSIFGTSVSGKLLPKCVDVLGQALSETYPDWNIVNIVNKSFSLAKEEIEPSLVGLACMSRDAVLITAMRETVVLYAATTIGAAKSAEKPEFDWQVDDKIVERANSIIDAFYKLTGFEIPRANAENAGYYYNASTQNQMLGRCVSIGMNENSTKYYHWAITANPISKELVVEDFWDTKVWTTETYKEKLSKL